MTLKFIIHHLAYQFSFGLSLLDDQGSSQLFLGGGLIFLQLHTHLCLCATAHLHGLADSIMPASYVHTAAGESTHARTGVHTQTPMI